MHPWLYASEHLQVPTYFACLMVAFTLGTVVLRREALRSGVPVRLAMDLALWSVPTALVGARLAHVLLVAPRHYWTQPLETLQIAYGGFVFYGGLFAAALLLWRFCRAHGLSPWVMGDLFAISTAFGLVFGRLGCLGGGCCFGRPASWPLGVAVPWGVRYYQRGHVPEELLAISLHPTPLYEALFALALFVGLSRIRQRGHAPGEVLLAFVGLYGLGRSVIEIFRADAERGLYLGGYLSTSQIIGLSSTLVALGVWVLRNRGHAS